MSAYTYEGAIRALGLDVIAAVDLGDWVAVLGEDYGSRFAFLVIGYGSCSGCDAWEAAENAAGRARLVADLLDGAKWFDEFEQVQAYVADAEYRDLEWYGHEDGWAEFKAKVAAADEYTREPASET